MNQPTPEQARAVVAFAEREGPQWKAKLHMNWTMASYPDDRETSHLLQQVRNQLGPQWLEMVTLPQLRLIAEG
jgi:hypothetical protein